MADPRTAAKVAAGEISGPLGATEAAGKPSATLTVHGCVPSEVATRVGLAMLAGAIGAKTPGECVATCISDEPCDASRCPLPDAAAAADVDGAASRASPPPPDLTPDEVAQRERLLATQGALAATLRALDAQLGDAAVWCAEAWRWVLFLIVVRGFRGATTVDAYVRHLLRFAAWVRETRADYTALTPAQMDGWQRWLYMRHRNSTPARRQALMAVRSFYRWRATRVGAKDLTEGYPTPKRWQRAPRKYSQEELRKLFAAAKHSTPDPASLRDTTLMLLLLTTGLRREELATLRLDQLELDERIGVVRCLGKGAKERTVPIEGPIVGKLHEWLLARGELPNLEADTVFVQVSRGYVGKPISLRSVEMIITRCARRAKLREWGVHRFRVTFATLLYDDGVDIERIRILMGHESIETTRRYLAVSARMNRCRLKSHRQHMALGTVPADLPRWARELERKKHGEAGIL